MMLQSCYAVFPTSISSSVSSHRFLAHVELENRGWKLNNLTSVIHSSLGVSSNYSLFFLSSCWLFVIHNRFRVRRISPVKCRFN